jgi:hypothetical protein
VRTENGAARQRRTETEDPHVMFGSPVMLHDAATVQYGWRIVYMHGLSLFEAVGRGLPSEYCACQ